METLTFSIASERLLDVACEHVRDRDAAILCGKPYLESGPRDMRSTFGRMGLAQCADPDVWFLAIPRAGISKSDARWQSLANLIRRRTLGAIAIVREIAEWAVFPWGGHYSCSLFGWFDRVEENVSDALEMFPPVIQYTTASTPVKAAVSRYVVKSREPIRFQSVLYHERIPGLSLWNALCLQESLPIIVALDFDILKSLAGTGHRHERVLSGSYRSLGLLASFEGNAGFAREYYIYEPMNVHSFLPACDFLDDNMRTVVLPRSTSRDAMTRIVSILESDTELLVINQLEEINKLAEWIFIPGIGHDDESFMLYSSARLGGATSVANALSTQDRIVAFF